MTDRRPPSAKELAAVHLAAQVTTHCEWCEQRLGSERRVLVGEQADAHVFCSGECEDRWLARD
jgi:hypothetical protein